MERTRKMTATLGIDIALDATDCALLMHIDSETTQRTGGLETALIESILDLTESFLHKDHHWRLVVNHLADDWPTYRAGMGMALSKSLTKFGTGYLILSEGLERAHRTLAIFLDIRAIIIA